MDIKQKLVNPNHRFSFYDYNPIFIILYLFKKEKQKNCRDLIIPTANDYCMIIWLLHCLEVKDDRKNDEHNRKSDSDLAHDTFFRTTLVLAPVGIGASAATCDSWWQTFALRILHKNNYYYSNTDKYEQNCEYDL